MNRYKDLIKNIGVLTIGSFSTKILAFLLVPFYTNILTTQEYGIYDLINTIITLLLPIVTLNIAESVLRFSMGTDDTEKKKVFTIGTESTLWGIIIAAGILLLNSMMFKNNLIEEYTIFIFSLFALQAIVQILVSFARGNNDISGVAVGGVISSLIIILLNIILLGVYRLGLRGYFMSTIIGYAAICIFYSIRLKIWNYICLFGKDIIFLRKMRQYCIPLIFNNIGWWVNNASDRFVVTWICGVDENGIYSIAYKIPAVLTAFQTVFNQAWLVSSVQEFDRDDRNGFFKTVYSYSNCISCCICFLLLVFVKPIAGIMFSKEFYEGWIYSPLLTIAVVFGTLSGMLGGIYNSANKTKIVGYSTCIGAVINIILNIILVCHIGAMGAAVATVISGIAVWIIRLIYIRDVMNIKIKYIRDLLAYIILFGQTALLFLIDNNWFYFMLSGLLFLIILSLFADELKHIKNKGRNGDEI